MQASEKDLNSLLLVQDIDLKILRKNKEIEELPQRETIVKAREKRTVITEKHNKIDSLKKDASKRLSSINDEDESLQKKENGVQAALQAANGDYRNVEARSKELAGIVKRRETLSAERAQIEEELEKIGAIERQLAHALDEVDSIEDEATAAYKSKGGSLKNEIAQLEADKAKMFSGIDPDLVKIYSKTAEKVGSVAIGKLEDTKCGVCRATIDSGRLIDLRNQAPLGVCPSCKRLLIIG